MDTKKKDKIINIIIFAIFLILGTYFIFIETWLLPIKIIIFIVFVLILKSAVFPKNKIIKQTTALLREQINEAMSDNDLWHEKFGSKFALGYIMGFSTILIKSKTKNEEEVASGTKKVFENLFGKDKGIRVMATASISQKTEEFENGLEQARIDLIEFIDNDGERPHGLKYFLKGN